MTAPPMPPPMPPMNAAPPPAPLGGPPMPPGMGAPPPPPLMGGAMSPQAVVRQQENNALAAGYLAAKRATAQALAGPAPFPAAGATLPPAPPPSPVGAPPLATGIGVPPPMPVAPSPGPGAAPAPVTPPAMAEGGVVGDAPVKFGAPGVDLLPGVVPGEVLLAAWFDRFGGGQGQQMQRFAAGGMVSPELMAMMGGADGGVSGNGVSGDIGLLGNGINQGSGQLQAMDVGGSGNSIPGGSDMGAGLSDALTPEEAAQVDSLNAGPPAPKSFVTWVESGAAQASDYPLDREVYEAALAAPDKLKAIFEYARRELKVDPSEGSPELKRAVQLPTGQPTLDMKIQASREERRN